MSNPPNPPPPPSVFKHTDTNGPILIGALPSRSEIMHALARLPHAERVTILDEAARYGSTTISGDTSTRPMNDFERVLLDRALESPVLASNRAARRAARGRR